MENALLFIQVLDNFSDSFTSASGTLAIETEAIEEVVETAPTEVVFGKAKSNKTFADHQKTFRRSHCRGCR